MKQLDKSTLFLSSVIVLSCSVRLFHMDPIQIVDREIWLIYSCAIFKTCCWSRLSCRALFAV